LPAQPQQFEGPELQPLLERIRQELGPAATILQAERTRRRSLRSPAGRLLYRLTVAPPDAPTGPAPASRLGQRLAPSPDPFAALADAASDRFEPNPAPALLATLPAPDPAPALDPVPRPAPESPPEPGPGAFAALLAEAAAALAEPPAPPVEHFPVRPTPVRPAQARPARPRRPRVAPPTPARPGLSNPVLDCRLRRAGLADLDAEAVVGAVEAGRSLREALAELFSHLPPAPPLPGPTDLTVLVGPRRLGLGAARALGRLLPEPPGHCTVLRADGRLLEQPLASTRGEPSPQASRGARGTRPRLVVLDAGYAPRDRRRAEEALAALAPTCALGVVAATDKPEDVASWAGDLGLRGLCVTGLRATSSPASVLRLGLPVLVADGRAFGGDDWARLLEELVEG
jgi:hypothetical protein